MALPPGTLRALSGDRDAIVIVVLACMAFGAVALGAPPWAALVILVVALVGFEKRRAKGEEHRVAMARLKVDEAAVRVEATKARYRELYTETQPRLDLERPARRVTGSSPRRGERGGQ